MTKHSNAWFKSAVGIALLVVCSLLPLARLSAQPLALLQDEPGGPVYLGGQLLIQFKPNATDAHLLDGVKRGALTLIKHIHTDAMKARNHLGVTHMWTGLPVRQAIEALKNHPAVEFAEPNWIYSHQDSPSDLYFVNGSLWGMYGDQLSPVNQFGSQADEAWFAGYTGDSSVVVGVIDQGIQFTHPDLQPNIWTNPYDLPNGVDDDGNGYIDDTHGWNCFNDNNVIYTAGADAHGTHVSGTIGAVANNGGVVGINWHVSIISGKFLGPNGGSTADAIEAVDYFTNLKIKHSELNIVALNNSWGGAGFSQALLDAIVRAAQQDILFVAAAGNGDWRGRAINTDASPFYPACYNTFAGAGYDSVISVTAIASGGGKASWANYGATTVDLGAPGVGIWSTVPTDTYAGDWSGTSMATPHVTGAIALYASTHPGATAAETKNAILGSATPTASLAGKTVTGGRLDLSTVIAPPGPPTIPPTPTGLTATAGNNQVSLAWNASAGATSYNVKRGMTSGSYDTPVTGVTTTSYIDTTAANGTIYFYVVSAVNSAGESGNSGEVSATPQAPPSPPAAPTGLLAMAVSKSQINLSWTDNSGDSEDGFKIERSTDGSTFTEIATLGKNVTTFQNTTGLSRNKTYYYRVRAHNAGGNSGYSNIASAKTFKN